jgi:hypothetical protein
MHKLQLRLESYWRMELFNAVLVPFIAIEVLVVTGQAIGLLCISCLVPTVALLIAGGCYWRLKARQLRRVRSSLYSTFYWLDRIQRPLLVSCIAVSLLCIVDLSILRLSVSTGDRLVAIVSTILAILEYINYYHRQLQHFDHAPDFRRLFSGRGFRKSQMRADLERFRHQTHLLR